jgi:mono/diheme cytochrome c family protein
MSRILLAFCLLAAFSVPLVAASDEAVTSAEEAEEVVPASGLNPGHVGYGLYQSLCSECHGVGAVGDGPRARFFDPRPVDLTRLTGLDGAPPRLEPLTRVIDGRRAIRAHEQDGMPVWGDRLVANESDLERRERARIRLVQTLAEYLLSIQSDD